jgi:hypothetical protein
MNWTFWFLHFNIKILKAFENCLKILKFKLLFHFKINKFPFFGPKKVYIELRGRGGGKLGPYPSIKKNIFWIHWDLVWDLDPDPSTSFRIWIRRQRGGVNTWNIEISFEGTPTREQSESLTETEDLDLGSHSDADREEDERKSRALQDRVPHSHSLDRCSSSNSSLCACRQRRLALLSRLLSAAVAAARGSCRCGLQTNTLSVTCSLDPCFLSQRILEKAVQ